MGLIQLSDNILLLQDNRLPADKDVRDKEYSNYLKDNAYVFRDGNEEYVDLFLFKVGINGNYWGTDLQTADQNADTFQDTDLLIDVDQIVHDSGKYSEDYIKQNSQGLRAGKIEKIKKYDLDGDGKNDYFRAIAHLDSNVNPITKKTGVEMFNNALAAGYNETSIGLIPLNANEKFTQLKTWRGLNVVMVKNGAYLTDSKIRGLCTGSHVSCSNALAASLNDPSKLNISLMQIMDKYHNMGNPNDPNSGSNDGNPPAGNTQNGNPPVGSTQIFNFGNVPANQAPDTSKPEQGTSNEDKGKEVTKTAEQLEIERLTKENKALTTASIASIKGELAPVELFASEDEMKTFHKEMGEDLVTLSKIHSFVKSYMPKVIAYHEKVKSSGKKQDTESSNDKQEKEDKKENPLAAALIPNFNNDIESTNNLDSDMVKSLSKYSLRDLVQLNKKNQRGFNVQ